MDQRELELWETAKKRVSFRYHFGIYLAMIPIFCVLWYATTSSAHRGVPWPIFPICGWGIGVLFHYLSAYRRLGDQAINEEFEKLKKNP